MIKQDLTKFAALIVGIGEIYGKAFTAVTIETYWNVLQSFEFAAVKQAVYLHLGNVDTGKYLPKPADLILAIQGSSATQALQAWSKVIKAAQQVGSYTSLAFDDALIHVVIQEMGGWQNLCKIEVKQLPFIAREFQERYRGYVIKNPKSYPKYLVGLIESQNRSYGYLYPPPLLFGDQAKAQRVITTGLALTSGENYAS